MFTKQKRLLTCSEYKRLAPLTDGLRDVKRRFDEELKQNFVARRRLTVVCGPCSADEPTAMRQYLTELKAVADACPKLLTVARVYTSKPHSNGVGYKGTAFQLTEKEAADLHQGILRCRLIMIDCLRLGLPVADELLYPELYGCFDDLVSYWFVGARSSEDSLHRNLASGLDVCCGLKNPLDGNIERAVDSVYAASRPSVFPYGGVQVSTSGCRYAHLVLRGGVSMGEYRSNLGKTDVEHARKLLCSQGLNDFVMADLNHANSGKVAAKQVENARIALDSGVDGVMIESYLTGGANGGVFGCSQTDDCLGIGSTANLLANLNDGWRR